MTNTQHARGEPFSTTPSHQLKCSLIMAALAIHTYAKSQRSQQKSEFQPRVSQMSKPRSNVNPANSDTYGLLQNGKEGGASETNCEE